MIILLVAAAAAAAAPRPADLKTYKDWTVGCDNVRSCHATSLLREDQDPNTAAMLNVKRDGAPGAAPVISLMGDGKASALLAAGKRIRLRPSDTEGNQAVDPLDAAPMIAALRSAPDVTVIDGAGKPAAAVSLAGVSAALLYMDDVQKRIGTVTALARPGSAPESQVPAPPPLPLVRSGAIAGSKGPVVGAARLAALRKASECVPEDKDWPGYGVEQESLDSGHSLILLGCGAGAYNESSVPYIATRNGKDVDIRIAGFDLRPSGEDAGVPMLVNAGWDPKEQRLGSFAKGRGIGDCGIGEVYAWDGARFRLVEQTEMSECRGSIDYITTWRARVVR